MSICFLLILLLNSFTINVFAEEQKYKIESAKFYVTLNTDGSATVTETWILNYKQGKFTRFYKNIQTSLPMKESFDIEINEVFVDGVACTETKDKTKIVDYTYLIEENYERIKYEIFIHSEKETREFKITYTLKNVVKFANHSYYMFQYRFLPKGFKENISKLDIEIHVPSKFSGRTTINPTKGIPRISKLNSSSTETVS